MGEGNVGQKKIKPAEPMPSDLVADSFLACLKNVRHETSPFDYWLLENPLPEGCCDDIANLLFPLPEGAVFNGKRETNNALRVYLPLRTR